MKEQAIRLDGIGKKYVTMYRRRLRDTGERRKESREFWALKDITLDIARGEVFGIIGANGAGKSTLLKILTSVTAPTEGKFEINGRLNAMLELGTGFHPELTGIENIYVSAALHGISRAETRGILNDIVAFSGIGDAVHQSVRTYSSGMYVRLAFSLALHLRPDILLLDEILAVGDEEFQKKCFDVIQDFQRKGVTILLVSHDLKMISILCHRVLLLDQGRILEISNSLSAIRSYNRCRARSLQSGPTQLLFFDKSVHLHAGSMWLTDRFGVYTSYRSHAIWYDATYSDWQVSKHTDTVLVLTGKSLTQPLIQVWRFEALGNGYFEWSVHFNFLEECSLDRIQCNVMLDNRFRFWEAGTESSEFPVEFDPECGEDWTRMVITGTDTPISARFKDDAGSCKVTLESQTDKGALLVVNSNPEYNSRVLQFIRILPTRSAIEPGEFDIFKGIIRVLVED